jgi:hypothetical protein
MADFTDKYIAMANQAASGVIPVGSNIVAYVLVIALGLIAATDAARTERTSLARQQMEQAARSYQTMPAPYNYRR